MSEDLFIISDMLNKEEALTQIISNLDKLEVASSITLSSINYSLLQRKEKISSLHSRIIRINETLSLIETIPQALNLISQKIYPDNPESFIGKTISPSNSTFSFQSNPTYSHTFNKDLQTSQSRLDSQVYDEILSSFNDFQSLKKELSHSNIQSQVNKSKVDLNVEMLSSIFNFTSKVKEFGKKIESSVKEVLIESDELSNLMKKSKKRKVEKPSTAPESLNEQGSVVKKLISNREKIRQKTIVNIDSLVDSKLKKNINLLTNVVDISTTELTHQSQLLNSLNDDIDYQNDDLFSMIENEYGNVEDDVIGGSSQFYQLPVEKIRNKRTSVVQGLTGKMSGSVDGNSSSVVPVSVTVTVPVPVPVQVPVPVPVIANPVQIKIDTNSNSKNIPLPPKFVMPQPKIKKKDSTQVVVDQKEKEKEKEKEEVKKKEDPFALIMKAVQLRNQRLNQKAPTPEKKRKDSSEDDGFESG